MLGPLMPMPSCTATLPSSFLSIVFLCEVQGTFHIRLADFSGQFWHVSLLTKLWANSKIGTGKWKGRLPEGIDRISIFVDPCFTLTSILHLLCEELDFSGSYSISFWFWLFYNILLGISSSRVWSLWCAISYVGGGLQAYSLTLLQTWGICLCLCDFQPLTSCDCSFSFHTVPYPVSTMHVYPAALSWLYSKYLYGALVWATEVRLEKLNGRPW